MDVRAEVTAIISNYLGVKPEDIHPETSLTEDLGADSLDCVEITMAIEEKFSIEIPNEDAEGLRTIDKIVKYIESKTIK